MTDTIQRRQEYRTHNMILTVYPSGTNWLYTRVHNENWDQWRRTAVNQEQTEKVLKQIIKINQG